MAKIFISYIHEDFDVAFALQQALRKSKFGDTFLAGDPYQISAGTNWLDEIKRALGEATVVILLCSPRSMERPWVNFEAGAAWLGGKILIPVCYGSLTPGQLDKPYSNFQAVDLTEQHGVSYLVSSLGLHLHGVAGIMELTPNQDFEKVRELALQNRVGEQEGGS